MSLLRHKLLPIVGLMATCLFLPNCAGPLEQLVERQHQERIDQANANLPVAQGAADRMGSYMAESAPRITLQDAESPKKP